MSARAAVVAGSVLLLIGVTFSLYLATLTHFHSFDSVAYALNIRRFEETGRAGWLFHPHHLLFNCLGWISHETLVCLVDSEATTLTALQVFTCGFGALGVGLFAVWIHEETRSRYVSALAAAALGGSWGWWFASTDGRANVAATALLPLVLWALSRAARASPSSGSLPKRYAGLAGLALGAVCLLHESHVLFLPVALGAAFLPAAPLKARLRRAIALLAAFTATVAIPYVLVLILVKRLGTLSEMQAWLLSYARQDTWWSFALEENLFKDARAEWKFLTGQDLSAPGGSLIWGGPASSVSLLLWTVLTATGIYGWFRGRIPRSGPTIQPPSFGGAVALSGLILYAAFFTIWDPGYYVFWCVQSLFFIALLAFGWQSAARTKSVRAALFLIVLTLGVINYSAAIQPRQETTRNPHLGLAQAVRPIADRGGILLATGTGKAAEAEVYVPYFARMQVLVLHQAFAEANGDPDQAFASLQQTVGKVLGRGNCVFLLSEVVTPGEGQRALARRYGVSPGQIEAFLSRYQRHRVGAYQDLILYRLSPRRQQH
ncbi:MAG: hypothetical protein H7Z41_00790 [Cytophagales bacterium]|nr:hypothetical protein [Armatimonadota bacterium]